MRALGRAEPLPIHIRRQENPRHPSVLSVWRPQEVTVNSLFALCASIQRRIYDDVVKPGETLRTKSLRTGEHSCLPDLETVCTGENIYSIVLVRLTEASVLGSTFSEVRRIETEWGNSPGKAGICVSNAKLLTEFDTGVEKAVREIHNGVEHKKE